MSGKPMKKASGKGTRRSSIARGMSAIAGSSPRVRRGSVEAKLVRANPPNAPDPIHATCEPSAGAAGQPANGDRAPALLSTQPGSPLGVSMLDRNVLLAEPATMWFPTIGELEREVRTHPVPGFMLLPSRRVRDSAAAAAAADYADPVYVCVCDSAAQD